jgi:hypothetical protein
VSTAISATGDEGGTTVGAGVASAGAVICDGPRWGVVISVEFDAGRGSAQSAVTDPNKTVAAARKSLA